MKRFSHFISMFLCLLLCIPLLPWASALSVSATSAFIMDADTGEALYAKQADLRRTPASMTKVLTSYIVFQELEKGTLTLDTQVPISAHAAAISRDSSYPLSVPLTASSYSVNTLLTLLHVPSASGACVALAEKVSGSESAFVQRMNATAQELGLDAVYYCVHGCGPNKITARSQAELTRHFIDTYPDVLRYTSQSSVYFEGNTYSNGNTLVNGSYPGCDGFKTGTFGDSGYCLSSTAVRNGRRVIAIAMNADSKYTRISDSAQLLDYGFAEIAKRDAARSGTTIAIQPSSIEAQQFVPLSITASISGVTYPYVADAQWFVNGQALENFHNASFSASNGKSSTLRYVPTGNEGGTITAAFVLTMPDGSEKRGETTIAVNNSSLSLGGVLNPSRVECYPGLTIPVTAVVTASGAGMVYVPAQWKLDGQPIQGFYNPQFSIANGQAVSTYSLTIPAGASAGTHTLSFCLAEGSAAQTELSCEITVLPVNAAAA